MAALVALGLLWWLVDDGSAAVERGRATALAPPPAPGPVSGTGRAAPLQLAPAPRDAPEGEVRPAGPAAQAGGSDPGGDPPDGAIRADETLRRYLAENAAAAEKYVDRYCEVAKSLQDRKALAEPPRSRDAALYLSSRVDWEGGRIGSLHLPASITDRMGNPPQAWRGAGPELYAGLDFSWMTDLLQFDHWTMLAAGPLRDDEAVSFFEAPLPNYVTLQNWVKLRLLKGVHDGELESASREVRHLAALCASTGTLVGEMIRVAIYNIERKTWEDVGQPIPQDGLTADDAFRARHASLGGTYFLYPGVPRAVREKALKCVPTRCSSLLEGIGVTASFRALVPSAQQDLDWLLAQKPCDDALARRLTNVPPVKPELLEQMLGSEGGIVKSMAALTDGGL